jgi:hypothetical protein
MPKNPQQNSIYQFWEYTFWWAATFRPRPIIFAVIWRRSALA